MADKRLIIVDGYSLLYRAFFATRYLSTSDGKPTNALYGFCNMLFILFEREHPDAVVVALDAPGKTFRHHYFAEYKATRSETADELKAQLPWARDLIAALGIPSIEVTGFEADDVVGTISRLAEEEGYATLIITGDNDALQLVDESVRVVTPKVGVTDVQVMDVAAVTEKYSVPPTSLPDWK
ncbi:MAG: DNA polymerase I, partial [Fimbriimonadaceae bacterium]|nr:DNA polymerase I [Fimbriimonadaceae bacterium]